MHVYVRLCAEVCRRDFRLGLSHLFVRHLADARVRGIGEVYWDRNVDTALGHGTSARKSIDEQISLSRSTYKNSKKALYKHLSNSSVLDV